MQLRLTAKENFTHEKKITIAIGGSKSESNRLLILQALFPNICIKNLSTSDDTQLLQQALRSQEHIIDIQHAGTAMRFLTAFFAIQEGKETVLTGSKRMLQRPIKPLVDTLNNLGANITYANQEGFPPLKIIGQKLTKNVVAIDANMSSQYISALLLIAPKLKNGLTLNLTNKPTSLPYILMTIELLRAIGVQVTVQDDYSSIVVAPFSESLHSTHFTVAPDWSSASYFYSLIALSPIGSKLCLEGFQKNSIQGDKAVVDLYKNFGVETTFKEKYIEIKKEALPTFTKIELDLNKTPDIAQTIAVTCLGLNISCTLKGLHTLKIKETDRLVALKNELEKFGAQVSTTQDSLNLESVPITTTKAISIKTYNDHRMAMAFAPLALKTPIVIEDSKVVSKSFPNFWEAIQNSGIHIVSE